MSALIPTGLEAVLKKIDRPGSFCTIGSAPAVLPGLEVAELGPVGLPLTASQARELKKHCEQAPYGKGTETLVDTSVRRVWRLTPDRFSLTNPDWDGFLGETLEKVQDGLGLEKKKLEATLYDLLLYEKGSFFLPHRDGEKQDRMVATLVVVLPSAFEGGELVVRHEGKEEVIDFGASEKDKNLFRLHYAAFYADCEHEVRPLKSGHRLCLIYNLSLAKGRKVIGAPTVSKQLEQCTRILRDWAADEASRRVGVLLEHQYTQEGLSWDTLKGVDRVKADVLREAARQAGCQAYLALLTLHESGSAVDYGYNYGRRRRWGYYEEEDEDSGPHEMDEVYETSLMASHWSDTDGNRPKMEAIPVKEEEILDAEAIREVEPEEQFEGYTGNAGMTLDRWYRHGAIFLWPNRRHFEVLCGAGPASAVAGLSRLLAEWKRAKKADAPGLKAQCIEFARAVIATWPTREQPPYRRYDEEETPDLLTVLEQLDEVELIRGYLKEVLTRDASAEPGKGFPEVCQRHGWLTYQAELEEVLEKSSRGTIERNVRLLEEICLAKGGKKTGHAELCEALATKTVGALFTIDRELAAQPSWHRDTLKRTALLARLARSLLATGQFELFGKVVDHALADPEQYPLVEAHLAALHELRDWLPKHVKEPCPPLGRWLTECRGQLEAATAEAPRAPVDWRRPTTLGNHCGDCAELVRFLNDPTEGEHRFRMPEDRRRHLQGQISQHKCDVNCRTERKGSPHTLVCTKNTASYERTREKYEKDLERLAAVRAIEASLPG